LVNLKLTDLVILFLTYGPKDRWSDLVLNPDTDIISLNIGEITDTYSSIDILLSRIKKGEHYIKAFSLINKNL
jgi:hypothetical protein